MTSRSSTDGNHRLLVPPPPAALDPYLDAAARCFARHGVRRTSVQDVAAEIGVNRATVYRQVGPIPEQVRLLLARELHRLVGGLLARLGTPIGPTDIVEVLAHGIEEVRTYPVFAKVREDEPELLVGIFVSGLPEVIGRIIPVVAPVLEAGMEAGSIAPRDPLVVADWLVRVSLTLVVDPPPGDLVAYLSEMLRPALDPSV